MGHAAPGLSPLTSHPSPLTSFPSFLWPLLAVFRGCKGRGQGEGVGLSVGHVAIVRCRSCTPNSALLSRSVFRFCFRLRGLGIPLLQADAVSAISTQALGRRASWDSVPLPAPCPPAADWGPPPVKSPWGSAHPASPPTPPLPRCAVLRDWHKCP